MMMQGMNTCSSTLFPVMISASMTLETPASALAPSYVEAKESALRYMCNFSDNDSIITLLTSSMSVFLGARMLCCIRYMASPECRW
jgi:hypothetical protein